MIRVKAAWPCGYIFNQRFLICQNEVQYTSIRKAVHSSARTSNKFIHLDEEKFV